MDTKPQSRPTGSSLPTPDRLKIEGANDLFVWQVDTGEWWQVVPFSGVLQSDADTGGLERIAPALFQDHLFDPGPWPDGWIGFGGADERLYFDCRGDNAAKDGEKAYTVWSLIGLEANELATGIIYAGPEDLATSIGVMVDQARTYFEGGVTPVSP